MPLFTGQLRSNEIFAALYNMIISQRVFAGNISGLDSSIVDMARVDGGLYGDQKLFYSTDALGSHAWGNDAEASNLLALHRPKAPEVQAIVLDVFRQIDLTVDYYLSKRAWGDEGTFMSFTSVMLGWMRDTKRVYDYTLYASFIGTAETSIGEQNRDVEIAAALIKTPASGTPGEQGYLPAVLATGEEANRIEAMTIAQHVADLLVDMSAPTRAFNDYGHLRVYSESDVMIIWNAKHVNKIKYVDLPTIFHNEGLIKNFAKHVLPSQYFGHRVDETLAAAEVYDASTNPTGVFTASGSNYTVKAGQARAKLVRSLIETDYTVSNKTYHIFPGDIIPQGATFKVDDDEPLVAYIEDPDIIAKVVTELPPFMSAFETGTSFFNPKSLTENHYLTWGHNTLEYLKGKPMITLNKD